MQPNNRSSFIPKKSIKRVKRVRGGKQVYILSYITYAIFFATLISVAAVFFYANALNNKLENSIAELDAQRVAFSQSEIVRIKEAERRFKIAQYLFSKHASVYSILSEMERSVVDDILFDTFSYTRVDDEMAGLDLTAGTNRFDAVAFQNNVLQSSNVLRNVSFEQVSKAGELAALAREGVVQTNNNQRTEDEALPVSFSIQHEFPVSEIPYSSSNYETAPITAPAQTTGTTQATGTESVDSTEAETTNSNEPSS